MVVSAGRCPCVFSLRTPVRPSTSTRLPYLHILQNLQNRCRSAIQDLPQFSELDTLQSRNQREICRWSTCMKKDCRLLQGHSVASLTSANEYDARSMISELIAIILPLILNGFLNTSTALADEVSAVVDDGSAAVNDASSVVDGLSSPTDGSLISENVASVLFLVAFVSLVLLTLGVLYLSVSSWLDQRQETTDQKEAGPASKYEEDMARYSGAIGKKKPKKPVAKATPKGFGKE